MKRKGYKKWWVLGLIFQINIRILKCSSSYAMPLSLNMSYMTIREGQWEQSEMSKMPEEYNFSDLLTAMEAELDKVQEDGYIRFYQEGSDPVKMMLDEGIVTIQNGEVLIDQKVLNQMIRVLCKQRYNEGRDIQTNTPHLSVPHPALNPTAYEGKFLTGCWGGEVKSAPQVGVMYAHSANQAYYGEDTQAIWRPNEEKGEFSANVRIMAMIGKESTHKKEAYDVI